jgi:hypothetical protein
VVHQHGRLDAKRSLPRRRRFDPWIARRGPLLAQKGFCQKKKATAMYPTFDPFVPALSCRSAIVCPVCGQRLFF